MTTFPLWALRASSARASSSASCSSSSDVGLSMMVGGFVGFILTRGLPAAESTLAGTIFEVATSPILVVIPLFVLMGVIAGAGGVIAAAFETFDKWLGHLRGGLAMATVGACAAFGAVCGDNIATAVTMNKAALPSMRKHGVRRQAVVRLHRRRRQPRASSTCRAPPSWSSASSPRPTSPTFSHRRHHPWHIADRDVCVCR